MRKITTLLVALLIFCTTSTTAFATTSSQVINATVPERHTVTITTEKGGSVVANGAICDTSVKVERQETQSWWLLPDKGMTVDKVYYNGEDVTDQVRAGVFTAPALVRDATLEVTFKKANVVTEENHTVSGIVNDENGTPIPGATVNIGGNTGVTDENGKFVIDDVPSGTWPITITDSEGKVIGIGEVTIKKSDGNTISVTEDENGNPVITPGKDTKQIDMALNIGENGITSITNVKDGATKTPDDSNGSDNSNGDKNTGDSNGNANVNGSDNSNGVGNTNGSNNSNGTGNTNGSNNSNGTGNTNGSNNSNGTGNTSASNNSNGNANTSASNNSNGNANTSASNNSNGVTNTSSSTGTASTASTANKTIISTLITKTGDNTPILFWLTLLVVSGALILITILRLLYKKSGKTSKKEN